MKYLLIYLALSVVFVSGCASNSNDQDYKAFLMISIERAIKIIPFDFKIIQTPAFIDKTYADLTIIKDNDNDLHELGISYIANNDSLVMSYIVSEHVNIFKFEGEQVFLQDGTIAYFKESKQFMKLSWKEDDIRYTIINFNNDNTKLTFNEVIQIANSRVAVSKSVHTN